MIARWKCVGVAAVLLLLSACRPARIAPPPDTQTPAPTVPEPKPATPSPGAIEKELERREQVAAALTDQGRQLLSNGRLDAAIRVFEQAVSQSPQYGPAYFYLAETWLKKNNGPQARAFHEQAALYLQDQTAWAHRLERQEIEIARSISGLSLP